uniref:Uncharacterized protein n=1 Tax=Clastoptera arizonana TaxID=38151 RepID=A0A1B6DBD6_9HEMI
MYITMQVFVYISALVCISRAYKSSPYSIIESRLCESITEPQEGRGASVMTDLLNYYYFLEAIKEMIEDGEVKGRNMLRFIGRDGPALLKVKYDHKLLQKKFQWGEEELFLFNRTLRKLKELWIKLLDMF